MLLAERGQRPFVAFRNLDAELELVVLEGDRIVIGRDPDNDLTLPWDVEVSRVHAREVATARSYDDFLAVVLKHVGDGYNELNGVAASHASNDDVYEFVIAVAAAHDAVDEIALALRGIVGPS